VEQVLNVSEGVNLAMKMVARDIAQRCAIFFFVLNSLSDSASTKHGKFQQAFGDGLCEQHTPFVGTICSLKAEPLLKMSSAADDNQRHGLVTTQQR
jgi:hypothetical protein